MANRITNSKPIPAAQYLRMSTEHQRFSLDNQRAVNMAYAADHGYEIIASYQDAGKSGLTLKARPELKRLLGDVLSGDVEYRAILVLDVSRWGRFQDADQAAHYEYMCREAGIPVLYCSEAFDNDGGTMASIVKHMKRVMAAEYSRELSRKIARAQRLQAGQGYKQGGHVVCGVRRRVIDKHGKPRMYLVKGQRKALSTDRVVFEHGPPSEISLVRRIFGMFALDGLGVTDICQILATQGVAQPSGRPWVRSTIYRLLRNELYIGVFLFGRYSNNLGRRKAVPEREWVRRTVMEPVIAVSLFRIAADRIAQTSKRRWSDTELEDGLARLLQEKGYLSGPAIDAVGYLPSQSVLSRRFGGLKAACRLVGYEKPAKPSRRHPKVFTDECLIDTLVRIHREHGYISQKVIDQDPDTPKAEYFARRLGGLRRAYLLAGIGQGVWPKKRADRHQDGRVLSDDELLDGLKTLWKKNGDLTLKMINDDPTLPCSEFFTSRFGSVLSAYKLIGYCETRGEIMKRAYARKKQQ